MSEERPFWTDGWWTGADGTRLHYRDYAGPADGGVPVLCVPGLTRNARDFAGLARRLTGRRVIVAELRGRGESAWAADPASYTPLVYVADIAALIDQAGLGQVVLFGTSLGGIVAMALAATRRELLAGALLNDVGPVIEPAGLARIGSYVGRSSGWPDWDAAAAAQAALHAGAYPDYGPQEWRDMAERLCREADGRIVPDYDRAIAIPFGLPPPDPAPDPWPLLDGLAGLPALLVRGALSDILSAATAERMRERLPDMEVLTLPRVGHAPTLDEPGCDDAIDRLLARVDAARGAGQLSGRNRGPTDL